MKKFSTFAVPLSGNKGSASMLLGFIDGLKGKFPIEQIEINVFSYYPKTDAKNNRSSFIKVYSGTPLNLLLRLFPLSIIYFTLKKIFPRKNIKAIFPMDAQAIIDSDIVFEIGGTTFIDSKLIKIPFNILNILVPLLFGSNVSKLSQTMGPFNKKFNALSSQILLPKLKHVVARGRSSEQHLRTVGVKNSSYMPDLSFLMQVPLAVTEEMRDRFGHKIQPGKTVGISPNSIVAKCCRKNSIAHDQIFANLINYLIDHGYTPIIIPHSYRKNCKQNHNNDTATILNILKSVKRIDQCTFLEEDLSPIELRALIGLMDFYIASRFHSMISAIAMKTPCFVMGWGSQKYLEVLHEFDLQNYYLDCTQSHLHSLIDGFELIKKDYTLIKEKCTEGLPVNIALAKSWLDWTDAFETDSPKLS